MEGHNLFRSAGWRVDAAARELEACDVLYFDEPHEEAKVRALKIIEGRGSRLQRLTSTGWMLHNGRLDPWQYAACEIHTGLSIGDLELPHLDLSRSRPTYR